MRSKSERKKADELQPEYDLRALLKEGVQGKYAKRFHEGTNLKDATVEGRNSRKPTGDHSGDE